MKIFSKDLVLNEIPLFADLSEKERLLIKARSSVKTYKKGEVIYKQGDGPSAFYCLVLGRVVISTCDYSGNQKILEYLHRGKYFGIISLLTAEPHSVTAQALNDSHILVIEKDDFDFIIKKIPALALDLSRTLSRRLKRKDMHQKNIFESTIISVFSSYSQAGKTMYVLNLGLSLAKETHKSAVILDIALSDKVHSLPQKFGVEAKGLDLSANVADNPQSAKSFILKTRYGIDLACFYIHPEDERSVQRLVAILSILVNDYHYIILDLPSLLDRSVFSILNQSDLIHILTSPEPVDLKRTSNLIQRLKVRFRFQEDKIRIIINEYKFSKITHEEQMGIIGKNIFATLPKIEFQSGDILVLDDPDCEYAKAIRRISRQLGESLVGLALGVGVGYGFCHIGVLRVFEEENIPIDIITGSSVGALIASLWAIGKSSHEIMEITKEFREPKHIWGLVDLTFPFSGFIKGNKLYQFLKKHIGDKTFYDTKIPLRIVASDVKQKEPRVFEKGLIIDAIMASCAMPGVFTPFKIKGEMLFDGGIISPLPTEILLKMGVKKIIAVNVTPSREDIIRQYHKLKEEITVNLPQDIKRRKWFDLGRHLKNIFKNNILDIIFSSVEILQSELAQKEAQLADVLLHPDTSGLYWLELHKSEEFAKRGEEEARRQLDKIRQLLNE
jgi:NTE family protein